MSQAIITHIQAVLAQLRPTIEQDGGDIQFVSFNSQTGVVAVKLMGACVQCPMSFYTLSLGVKQHLQSEIPQVTDVQAVP